MSIWTYGDEITDEKALRIAALTEKCVFCRHELDELEDERVRDRVGKCFPSLLFKYVFCCPVCGWWKVDQRVERSHLGVIHKNDYGAAGSLRQLNINDQSLQIEEIRSYLVVRYDARFHIDPFKY